MNVLRGSSPYAVDARGLGVRYSLRFTRKTTVRQSFQHALRRHRGPTEFWALRDVTFRVAQGESLAVIGPNGAGKSTLLQVLAGIIEPSAGTVEVRGQHLQPADARRGLRPGADRAGQHPPGRGVHGHGPPRDGARLPGIIEFADIGQFIDAPMRTYSSGMRARLGFSIATAVDPDVLLLDEVLATGDQVFREKSRRGSRSSSRPPRASSS